MPSWPGCGPNTTSRDGSANVSSRAQRRSPVAQLAEHLTVNQRVPGSSPGGGAISKGDLTRRNTSRIAFLFGHRGVYVGDHLTRGAADRGHRRDPALVRACVTLTRSSRSAEVGRPVLDVRPLSRACPGRRSSSVVVACERGGSRSDGRAAGPCPTAAHRLRVTAELSSHTVSREPQTRRSSLFEPCHVGVDTGGRCARIGRSVAWRSLWSKTVVASPPSERRCRLDVLRSQWPHVLFLATTAHRLPLRSLAQPCGGDWAEDALQVFEPDADDSSPGVDGRQDAGRDSAPQEVDAHPVHGCGVLERNVLRSCSDRGRRHGQYLRLAHCLAFPRPHGVAFGTGVWRTLSIAGSPLDDDHSASK